MAYTVLRMLLMLLMTVHASHADPLDSDAIDNLNSNDVIAAIVDVNHTTELFGNTYKQAVVLYKDHSDDIAALKEIPELVMQLKNEIFELKITNKEDDPKVKLISEENAKLRNQIASISKEATNRETKLNRTLELLTEQLSIRNLVAEFNGNKDWRALQTGLEAALDHDGAAYKQLQEIPWVLSSPAWNIGAKGYVELAGVLASVGSGADMTDVDSSTMLLGATSGGQLRTARILLENGANIEGRNDWGNTPMVLAGKYNQMEMGKYLKDSGADIDAASYFGWTGLHWAADNGNLPIVQFFVEAGASTSLKDRDNKTPLDVARDKEHTSVEKYLSRYPH